MIEKTEFGFTGSVTDLPAWARDNPELGLTGALAAIDALEQAKNDKQLLETVERQVTKGLTIAEIDTAPDAVLFAELMRLLEYNGGNVKVKDHEGCDARVTEATLFTTTTQHVTGSDLREAIKRALIIEKMFKAMGRFLDKSQVDAWLEVYNVPAYLR
jgi:hypothetical protein